MAFTRISYSPTGTTLTSYEDKMVPSLLEVKYNVASIMQMVHMNDAKPLLA